jgi:glycopeptide antibiotics resistance protein
VEVLDISSWQFFFIGLSAVICTYLALYAVKTTGNLKISRRHEIIKWFFCIYLLLAASFTFFPIHYTVIYDEPTFTPSDINFIPFKTISVTLGVFNSQFAFAYKLKTVFGYLCGNLFLLLPFGFFFPQLQKRFRTPLNCFIAAFAVSCSIQLIRFLENSYGLVSDNTISIDNVILNILGALAGFCVWRTLREKYC